MPDHFAIQCKGRAAGLLAIGLAAAFVAGCGSDSKDSKSAGGAASAADATTIGTGKVLWSSSSARSQYPSPLTVKAEPDPKIPKVTVRIAQAPYNDHSFESIGIVKGWYSAVGIDPAPKPQGKILDMDQMAPAMLAKQLDVGTMANSVWLAAMDQTTDNKMFTYNDTFLGHAILGNPKGHYKTFAELLEQGMSFKQAITAAMGQLKGKTYAYPSETSQRPFQQYALDSAGMKFGDTKTVVLDDPKIVELATANRTDFASPTSGPLVTQLLRDGWAPVVTVEDLIAHGDSTALESSVINSGLAATKDWLKDNHATALRVASVGYRIIDYKKEHQLEAAKIQIPFLNSIAGTKFTAADAKYLDEQVDPFFTFDEQADFFENAKSPWYYQKNGQATIDAAVKAGTLKSGHDTDQIILADDTWRELKGLAEAGKAKIDAVEAAGPSGKATQYLQQAKALYAARDYLDALRFAGAAELAEGSS